MGFFFYGIAIKRAPKVFLSNNPNLKADPPVAGASWGREGLGLSPELREY